MNSANTYHAPLTHHVLLSSMLECRSDQNRQIKIPVLNTGFAGKRLREFCGAGNSILYHARVCVAWIHPLAKITELRSVRFNMQI